MVARAEYYRAEVFNQMFKFNAGNDHFLDEPVQPPLQVLK